MYDSCVYGLMGDIILDDFFFQAEDGIRDLVRSRGLGDVYKRQAWVGPCARHERTRLLQPAIDVLIWTGDRHEQLHPCLLYTSDAADERSSVDLGGRRIIKKKKRATVW